MRTLQRLIVTGLVLTAGIAPAAAGTGSAGLAGVQVSYEVSDAVFDGPGCAKATWTMTYTQPADTDLDVTLTLGAADDPDPLQDSVLVDTLGPTTASESGTFCVTGSVSPLQAGGVLTVRDVAFNDLGEVALTNSPVSVIPNPTRFTRAVARRSVVRGTVVADTATKGPLGADGQVRVLTKRKGAWSQIGTATPAATGTFRAPLTRPVKKGKKVRVQISGCPWCTAVTTKATVR